MWYACITIDTPQGRKQRQFSTGLTDREEAHAVAVAAERAARKHREAPHQLRQALDRLAEEFEPAEDADPAAWLERWTESRAREIATGTAGIYRATTKAVAAWLRSEGIRRFSQLTPAVVVRLRDHLAEKRRASTVNVRMLILRTALNAAVRAKLMASNPANDLPALRSENTRRREFRPAELALLLPTLTGEWRAMVMLGLYTGQRLNDLALLRWRNVDLAAKKVTFSAGKTRKLVSLPLLDPVADALEALPSSENPDDPVVPGIFQRKREKRSDDFRTLLAAVGLARPLSEKAAVYRETAELGFHSLRHTATTMLKSAGVSDAIAREIIGHSSPTISRHYTHFDMDTLRAALEKMPSV